MIEAEFVLPYLAHAPMEPLDGYLQWDGERALARFGSQLQTGDHAAIAKVLGLPLEKVELADDAGRRQLRPARAADDASRRRARRGREGDRPEPAGQAGLDARGRYPRRLLPPARSCIACAAALRDGKIAAWSTPVVGQSIIKGTPFEAMMKDGIDPTSVEGASEMPYEIADFRCDLHTTDVGVPVLWWRSVGHTHTGYAVECFVDELLQAAGQDPVAGRLAHDGKAPRAAGALRAVAKLAGWTGPGPVNGRARGVAVVESFNSYVAQIAEVSLGEER